MQMVESRSVSISAGLHVLVLLIAAFGLPLLLPKQPDPEPMVMSVEMLPISALSNVRPSDKPITEAKTAPAPKVIKPAPPEPPKAASAPPTPPTPKPAEKTFDPDEGAAAPDKIKPAEKPKDAPKPKTNDDFEKIMADIKKEAEKGDAKKPTPATPAPKDAKDTQNVEANKTKSDKPYDDSIPLSISEKDAIRSQFIPCWNMPAGAKDAGTLAARVKVKLQADGTVISAELESSQSGRYNSDTFFRAAADSAVRAVYKCSPLKNLPSDKYGSWREMEINFDPKDI